MEECKYCEGDGFVSEPSCNEINCCYERVSCEECDGIGYIKEVDFYEGTEYEGFYS